MSAPISLPPHPKWGAASEAYGYTRDDGMRCVQAKYRNGAASPKHCAWWVQGTDGEYYVSHGDVKLERLRPYNAALLNNPHARHEPIILCEGPKEPTRWSASGSSRRITALLSPRTRPGSAAATW
jgi:hypothetical protein